MSARCKSVSYIAADNMKRQGQNRGAGGGVDASAAAAGLSFQLWAGVCVTPTIKADAWADVDGDDLLGLSTTLAAADKRAAEAKAAAERRSTISAQPRLEDEKAPAKAAKKQANFDVRRIAPAVSMLLLEADSAGQTGETLAVAKYAMRITPLEPPADWRERSKARPLIGPPSQASIDALNAREQKGGEGMEEDGAEVEEEEEEEESSPPLMLHVQLYEEGKQVHAVLARVRAEREWEDNIIKMAETDKAKPDYLDFSMMQTTLFQSTMNVEAIRNVPQGRQDKRLTVTERAVEEEGEEEPRRRCKPCCCCGGGGGDDDDDADELAQSGKKFNGWAVWDIAGAANDVPLPQVGEGTAGNTLFEMRLGAQNRMEYIIAGASVHTSCKCHSGGRSRRRPVPRSPLYAPRTSRLAAAHRSLLFAPVLHCRHFTLLDLASRCAARPHNRHARGAYSHAPSPPCSSPSPQRNGAHPVARSSRRGTQSQEALARSLACSSPSPQRNGAHPVARSSRRGTQSQEALARSLEVTSRYGAATHAPAD